MSKKKPNYTQFMRRPASLELSPPSNHEDPRPRISPPLKREAVSEEELPWGEVIVEFGPNDAVPLDATGSRSLPTQRGTAPAPPTPREPTVPAGPTTRFRLSREDETVIEGIAVFPGPMREETDLGAPDLVEWAFPGPGAPPLVFMAIAVLLVLCLL